MAKRREINFESFCNSTTFPCFAFALLLVLFFEKVFKFVFCIVVKSHQSHETSEDHLKRSQ